MREYTDSARDPSSSQCALFPAPAAIAVWLIRNLAEVPEKPAENLPKAIMSFPKYYTSLRKWNLRACHAALLFFGMMVINFVLSAFLVLHIRYAGLRSWTALLSNTFLLAYKCVAIPASRSGRVPRIAPVADGPAVVS